MASNPVFNRIEREAERGYAGFNDRGPQPPQPAGPWGATDQMTDRQLQDLYNQPAASPVQTGRLTLEDVKEAEQLLKQLEKKDGRDR